MYQHSKILKRKEPYGFIFFDPENELIIEIGNEKIYWNTYFLNSPEILHILITNKCNFKCEHCFLAAGEPLKNEMKIEEYEILVEQCKEMKIFQWALGGGEPLLRNDLSKIIELATNNDITCTLTTNGSLLTFEKINELKKAGLKFIQISIYNFDIDNWLLKVIENLKNANMPFGFNIILTKKFIQNIKFLKLIEKIKPSRINFIMPKPSKRSMNWYKDNCPNEKEVLKFFNNLKIRKSISISVDSLTSIILLKKHFKKQFLTWGCVAGRRFLTIFPDGKCYPCSHLIEKEWYCGNIRNEKLKDIWLNSKILKKFRNKPLPQPSLFCYALEK